MKKQTKKTSVKKAVKGSVVMVDSRLKVAALMMIAAAALVWMVITMMKMRAYTNNNVTVIPREAVLSKSVDADTVVRELNETKIEADFTDLVE